MSDKRTVEIEDLYRFRLISSLQVSPDGKMVAFALTRLRKTKNDYASNIWLVPADGGEEPFKFTGSDKRDSKPKWSPDGQEVAFISTRSGKPQIWVIRVRGGEARQLTRTKRGVGEFEWSPDGRWIVFTAQADNEQDRQAEAEAKKADKAESTADKENRGEEAASDEGLTATMRPPGEWEEDEEDEEEAQPKPDQSERARIFTRLQFKADGEGYIERRNHLFLIASNGGQARQITEGEWDAQAPRWSPDGEQLAFLANQEPDADYRNISDVFVMPVAQDGQPGQARRITNHDSAIHNVDWLPSGQGFVLFAHSRVDEGALATNTEVWTLSLHGKIHKLTESFDRGVGNEVNSDLRAGHGEVRPHFSHDGKLIYFLATNGGSVQIFSVPVEGGEIRQVVGGDRQILDFGVANGGIVFVASTAVLPNDIFRVNFQGQGERRLTEVNRDILSQLALSEPKEFWVDRPGGARLQGWMLMPPGYKQGEKYPLILEIHGGPHTAYGHSYFHEFQLLAAGGNIVMYANPRGSVGYGQQFADAILNDWGGIDYDDLMACVDYAISKGMADEQRLGVAGGSYGGYMTAWAVGHTQRFKAAVAMRAVTNLYSAWGSGDFTWLLWNWELQGTPQERTALYLERSPITYVEDMHTPLLITQAEDDLRVNSEQADQLYTALKVRKRDVKMVRFPSGGHNLSRSGKPSLRIERLREIKDWFDKYLGNSTQ